MSYSIYFIRSNGVHQIQNRVQSKEEAVEVKTMLIVNGFESYILASDGIMY